MPLVTLPRRRTCMLWPLFSLLVFLAVLTSAQDDDVPVQVQVKPPAEYEIDADGENVAAGDKSFKPAQQHSARPTMAPLNLNLTRPPTAQLLYRADRLINCAWSPVLTPEKEKPFLPDLYITYNMQGFVFASNAYKQQQERQKSASQHQHLHFQHGHHTTSPTPAPTPLPYDQEEVYRIRGKFPYVRYFSYTIYDMRLQSVTTLHDTQIKPVWGKNPFVDPSTTEAESGSYEIYITKDGRRGYPNEMAALRPNSTSPYALMSFRLQLLDPRQGADRSGKNRQWGYVDMPVVEILNHKNGQWEMIRQCPEDFRAQEEDFMEHLDMSFNRWWPKKMNLGADCNATEFSLFDPDRNPIIRRAVAVRNNNENYIFWCMPKDVTDRQYVVKVTGVLAQTPHGLFDEIRVAETNKYDARYVSFTTADAAPLYPSYQTLSDGDIRSHYTSNPTGAGWDRRYSLVATSDVALAKKCGLYHEDKDVLISFTRPPALPFKPHNPAIVMRELLPQNGWERNTEGVATASLRNECVGPDGKLVCDQAQAAKSLLKEFYPRVEVWSCRHPDYKPVQLH